MFAAVLSSGSLVPPELLRMILSVCSPIVAADSGLAQLKGTGFHADYLVGDLDSLASDDRVGIPGHTQVIELATDKDNSDTDAAVSLARELTHKPLVLVGGTGGRMDHWLSNLRLFDQTENLAFWLTADDWISKLETGQSRHLAAGRVSIFPRGTGPWKLESVGLRWPVEKVAFERTHSLSNEMRAGGGTVAAHSGSFFVLEPAAGMPWERPL